MLTPLDTLQTVETASINKATAKTSKLILMGFLAGFFIGMAALTSTITSVNLLANPDTYGLGKLIQGLVFSGGLIMVILGGTELFTGNSLMVTALISHKITLKQLLRNWGLVYLGNFLGALFLVFMVGASGILDGNSGLIGSALARIATAKVSMEWGSAFTLGILCNILVCIAVWAAFGAKSTAGKILAIIFPVTFFVACGFEHSIANMFYIPAGLAYAGTFSWGAFLANLIPVTLGNIIGGGIFIASFYSFSLNDVKINLCLDEKNPTKKSNQKSLKTQPSSTSQKSQNSQKAQKPQKTSSQKK